MNRVGKSLPPLSCLLPFEADTGRLYLDAEGTGATHGLVRMAVLEGVTELAVDDFVIC